MKTTIRIAAAALSFVAAGAAFAESPFATLQPLAATASEVSRTEVRAQVLQAGGPLVVTEAHLQQADAFTAQRSRADVIAETLAAIASGDLVNISGEVVAPGTRAAAESVQLARIGK